MKIELTDDNGKPVRIPLRLMAAFVIVTVVLGMVVYHLIMTGGTLNTATSLALVGSGIFYIWTWNVLDTSEEPKPMWPVKKIG